MSEKPVIKIPTKLSPSRIKDYLQCPKLFEFKAMGLSTPPTEATTKGTLAHHVFERIFDHSRQDRTLELALSYIEPSWRVMLNPLAARNTVTDLGEIAIRNANSLWGDLHELDSKTRERLESEADDYRAIIKTDKETEFLESAKDCVRGWFRMENPTKFDPQEREMYVTAKLSGIDLHGYIDRLDRVRGVDGDRYYISDYKTGKPPSARFQDEAFFQLAFYALLVEKQLEVRPYQLRLVYVSVGKPDAVLTRPVTQALLSVTQKKISDTWKKIQKSHKEGIWDARKQTLCGWCFFQNACPAFNDKANQLSINEIAEITGARAI